MDAPHSTPQHPVHPFVSPRELLCPPNTGYGEFPISGDPEPSAEDLALMRRLAAAGSLLAIEILDHVITGDGTARWVSLKDRGVF
jgi:hypothetical protein